MRKYSNVLTADVNSKGVLDIDVVKGCTYGMAAMAGGCYGTCYAAIIAKFRGIDFSKSVVRTVQSHTQAINIENLVKRSPYGFFRIGVMGDPSYSWSDTVEVTEWLAPYSTPVIVTKHWLKATDEQYSRMVACGAVLNTSVSALDSPKQLLRRTVEIERYKEFGGHSIARVVSCEFNASNDLGARLSLIQDRLLSSDHVIDNPLRVSRQHELVKGGVINLSVASDLNSMRTISITNHETYLGHCSNCSDRCGLSSVPSNYPVAIQPQLSFFQ